MTDDDLPPPSLSEKFSINLNGWVTDDEDEARAFGERLMNLTREYSRYLDLSLLEKVVVAWDYPAALAEISGQAGKTAVIPTSNEFGQGAAMTLPMRGEDGDAFKTVVVIQTGLISQMFNEDDNSIARLSMQSFIHELVHVDDQAHFAKTFPGGPWAGAARDLRHGSLLRMTEGAYAEYSATRRTAVLDPATGLEFLDLLASALREAHEEMLDRRKKYQRHQLDLDDFWIWAEERARFIFQALGYALGHYDGALALEDLDGELKAQLQDKILEIEAMPLGWLVDATREAILPIYQQKDWTGMEVLEPTAELAERLLNEFGLYTSLRDEQLYIDIPFRGLIDL